MNVVPTASNETPPPAPKKVAAALTTASGATTRSNVRPHGRGAKSASSPPAHAIHNSAAATVAGSDDHPSSASANAAPHETGSTTHSNRAHHSQADDDCTRSILRSSMSHARLATDRLRTGMATGIGSLPHRDAVEAAACVLRCLPELPCAPQLPHRSPAEAMLAQWTGAPEFTIEAHGGLLAFLDAAAARPSPPAVVKVQLVGPLTLGVAFRDEGSDLDHAFAGAVDVCRAWTSALTRLVADRLPSSDLVMFFDEPALVLWRDGDPPVAGERAAELLSAVLAATSAVTGIHVCGRGDLRVALAADPADRALRCRRARHG